MLALEIRERDANPEIAIVVARQLVVVPGLRRSREGPVALDVVEVRRVVTVERVVAKKVHAEVGQPVGCQAEIEIRDPIGRLDGARVLVDREVLGALPEGVDIQVAVQRQARDAVLVVQGHGHFIFRRVG